MLKIALSHDVDRVYKTYQYATHLAKAALSGKLNKMLYQILSLFKKNPYWTFDEIIRIENKFDVKSTFFFLNESIRFNPFSVLNWKLSLGRYDIESRKIVEIVRWLDKNGWEIGVHGSYNSYKDEHLLLKEKMVLERIVGHPVLGVRQHYLNLNNRTFSIQQKCGFKYDSSWGFTNDIGFKDSRYLPFNPFECEFKVIPLTLMDSCFMTKAEKWKQYERLLDQCESSGAVMVINFHNHVFTKYEFSGYHEAYIQLIERALERKAKFITLSTI